MGDQKAPVVNMPTRGGNSMSRGGSGMSRGGDPRDLATARRSLNPDNDRAIKRDQRNAQFSMKHQMERKAAWGEIGPILQEIDKKIISVGDRSEAIFLTLRRMNPEFAAIYNDSLRRIKEWKETVSRIVHTVNLSEIRDKVLAWNSDSDNPIITAMCFPEEWSIGKFSADNPDATLNVEEKREFMKALFFNDVFIEKCCTTDQTPPTNEEVQG